MITFTEGQLTSKSSNDPLINLQPRGGNLSEVVTGSGDTQNFFSNVGTAYAKVNDAGTWDTITITEAKASQLGAAVLNVTVDMTKDFQFNWDLQIYNNSGTYTADGLGFTFHPLYRPGEVITDSQGGASYTLPEVFGRRPSTGAVTSADEPENGQNLRSTGMAGGNLGITDLMNAIGFKVDTYGNYSAISKVPNTPYGSSSHLGSVYSSEDGSNLPEGAFVVNDILGTVKDYILPG